MFFFLFVSYLSFFSIYILTEIFSQLLAPVCSTPVVQSTLCKAKHCSMCRTLNPNLWQDCQRMSWEFLTILIFRRFCKISTQRDTKKEKAMAIHLSCSYTHTVRCFQLFYRSSLISLTSLEYREKIPYMEPFYDTLGSGEAFKVSSYRSWQLALFLSNSSTQLNLSSQKHHYMVSFVEILLTSTPS